MLWRHKSLCKIRQWHFGWRRRWLRRWRIRWKAFSRLLFAFTLLRMWFSLIENLIAWKTRQIKYRFSMFWPAEANTYSTTTTKYNCYCKNKNIGILQSVKPIIPKFYVAVCVTRIWNYTADISRILSWHYFITIPIVTFTFGRCNIYAVNTSLQNITFIKATKLISVWLLPHYSQNYCFHRPSVVYTLYKLGQK
jgi:hypothetical protein